MAAVFKLPSDTIALDDFSLSALLPVCRRCTLHGLGLHSFPLVAERVDLLLDLDAGCLMVC